MDGLTKGTHIQLPTFVWCLFTGVIIRNSLTHLFKFQVADSAIDVLGSVGLSIFLAIALMSLKLWELAGLATDVLIILAVQVVFIAISVAAGRLNSLVNVSAHAAPVPWPPVRVTEPASKP